MANREARQTDHPITSRNHPAAGRTTDDPSVRAVDPQLLPFINAVAEEESQAALEQLICDHAQPLIRNIVGYKLRTSSSGWSSARDSQEVEDITGDVLVKLVVALRQCKTGSSERAIANFRSYVAVMAYNESDSYLRRKYPKRSSLKNKIKYLLTHHPGLAIWPADEGATLCGFAAWRQLKLRPTAQSGTATGERTGPIRDYLQKRIEVGTLDRANDGELLAGVIEFAEAPIEIDDLVAVMAEVWGVDVSGVRDRSMSGARTGSSGSLELGESAQGLDAVLDQRNRIKQVWSEVIQLPVRQRVALLLNLKDEQGGPAIAMLPILRIASIRQIADALELSAEELTTFWNDLPLEDSVIGARLGATRQQVSNLRKCARERLSRRLASIERR
jgi:RNA polymerase sigma factor (sigma-70 family)